MALDLPNPFTVSIREASHDDLDSITRIFLAAFPFDPQYAYRFPYRKDHPEEQEKYTRMRLSEYLDGARSKAYKVLMAESPIIDDPLLQEPVAYAIFSLLGQTGKALLTPADHLHRRDCNVERMKAYRQAYVEGTHLLFNAYGDRQLKLVHLATHPKFWGKRAGSLLCQWGIEEAKALGVPVTAFSSGMGQKLYAKLGFNLMTSLRIQAEGDDFGLDYAVMALEPIVRVRE